MARKISSMKSSYSKALTRATRGRRSVAVLRKWTTRFHGSRSPTAVYCDLRATTILLGIKEIVNKRGARLPTMGEIAGRSERPFITATTAREVHIGCGSFATERWFSLFRPLRSSDQARSDSLGTRSALTFGRNLLSIYTFQKIRDRLGRGLCRYFQESWRGSRTSSNYPLAICC